MNDSSDEEEVGSDEDEAIPDLVKPLKLRKKVILVILMMRQEG